MGKLMTVVEVCEALGISRDTWDKWRARGITPPAKRLPNGQLRIALDDFEAWMEGLDAA